MKDRAIFRRASLVAVALALLVASPLACAPEPPVAISPPVAPRLVVLYSVCTVNKRYLQPYAEDVDFTPNLARFATESAVLTSHRTESGVSGTAFASIFTGSQADRHGVFKHPMELDGELYLVFEAFRDAGFETYYWSAHQMSRAELQYAQGVDAKDVWPRPLKGSDPRFKALLRQLAADPNRRALVVTSFTVTHAPWDVAHLPAFRESHPEEFGDLTEEEIAAHHWFFKRNRFKLQTDLGGAVEALGITGEDIDQLGAALDVVYKSKINLLDSYFGSTLDAISAAGLKDESLVAFTADHGQQMDDGELFRWTHGPDLAPDVIDVPLLIRGTAGSIEAREIASVSRSIDVYPTLAGLSGVEIPTDAPVDGVDFSAALLGHESFPVLTAYSHGTLRNWSFFDPDLIENIWASARRIETLYTWRRRDRAWMFEAQRVQADRPLARLDASEAEHKAAGRDLWRYREAMIEAFRLRNPDEAQSKEEDLGRLRKEDAEALRALGYIE